METSKGRYRSPPRGQESSKKRKTYYQVGSYGQYHSRQDEKTKAIAVLRTEVLKDFHMYLRSQSLCLGILVHKLNPSLMHLDFFIASGNKFITQEDVHHIVKQEVHLLKDVNVDMVLDHYNYMKENNLTICYSTSEGFGIARSQDSHFKEYAYTHPRGRDLSIIENEVYASGRGMFDKYGHLFCTFGLLGIMNHACPTHSSVEVKVEVDHNQEETKVFMQEKSMDVVLTWCYAPERDLDFVCAHCKLCASDESWDLIENALRILEPYYTRMGFGEDRKMLPNNLFEDWIPYIPDLFKMHFRIGESSCNRVDEPGKYFRTVLKACHVDISEHEMRNRLRQTKSYEDLLLGLHIAAVLFIYIE